MMQLIYVVDATVLIALALSVTVFLRLAYRRRGSIGGEILDRAFIFLLIICWLMIHGSHPLSMDFLEVVGLAAPLALAIGGCPLRSILYYGGILMVVQMFVIPRFDLGPLQLGFWLYWIGHAAIMGGACYDLLVNRYRPRWKDWGFACLGFLLYEIAVMPIELPMKVSHRLLLLTVFAMATVPWHMPRRERRGQPITPAPELDEDAELVYST